MMSPLALMTPVVPVVPMALVALVALVTLMAPAPLVAQVAEVALVGGCACATSLVVLVDVSFCQHLSTCVPFVP